MGRQILTDSAFRIPQYVNNTDQIDSSSFPMQLIICIRRKLDHIFYVHVFDFVVLLWLHF